MYRIKQIAPVLAVEDMETTLRFYEEVLLFQRTSEGHDYANVEKDGFEIHLVGESTKEAERAIRGQAIVYIEIEGIDELWEHVSKFDGRFAVEGLIDRGYGMREFHLEDPNGYMVYVGEERA